MLMSIEPWLFQVSAHSEESLGHFLGRFRRANHLKNGQLSSMLGLKYRSVSYWETPSRRRNPSPLQLIALSKLTNVAPEQLTQMLPPEPLHLQTRLCPVCYAEAPVHRAWWQQARIEQCERHQYPLLSTCPNCKTGFRTPVLWEEGRCESCGLVFEQMQSVPG
jgi:transcriptional regulator with XRE-family HTH domain